MVVEDTGGPLQAPVGTVGFGTGTKVIDVLDAEHRDVLLLLIKNIGSFKQVSPRRYQWGTARFTQLVAALSC